MEFSFIFQNLINGLTIGAMYALMALGYTLVYNASRLVNFSQSESYMLGAFGTLIVFSSLGISATNMPYLGAIIAALVAIVISSALGSATERFVFRPLRSAPKLIPVIASLGLSIAIQNTTLNLAGAGFNNVPQLWPSSGIMLGEVRISILQLVIFSLGLLLMVALDIFLNKTLLGKAVRAVAQDLVTARLMGISSNRVIFSIFIVASCLSGISGFLVALYYGSINFYMGFQAGISGFAAAILGGFGNVRGAIAGGLLLGVFEAFGSVFVASEWKSVIAHALILLVLILRPQGIFGKLAPEKL